MKLKLVGLNSLKFFASEWKFFLTLSITGVGIFLAVYEYSAVRNEVKQNRSLQFSYHFYSEEMMTQYLYLSKIQNEIIRQMEEQEPNVDSYSKKVMEKLKTPATLNAVYYYLNYFELMAVCVQEKLCAESGIEELLYGRAKYIYLTFSPYICQQRKTDTEAWTRLGTYLGYPDSCLEYPQ